MTNARVMVMLAFLACSALACSSSKKSDPINPALTRTTPARFMKANSAARTVTVTINTGDEEPTEMTLNLADDFTAVVHGASGALADIPAGSGVLLTMNKMTALKIETRDALNGANNGSFVAMLKSIDMAKKVLLLGIRDDENRESDAHMALAPDAKITVAGKRGEIGDFKPGQMLLISAVNGAITHLELAPVRDTRRRYNLRAAPAIFGSLGSDGNAVFTVGADAESKGSVVTVRIDANTRVVIDGKITDPNDLSEGRCVLLTAVAGDATRIEVVAAAKDPARSAAKSISGKLQAVNAAGKTITLSPAGDEDPSVTRPSPVTVNVTSGTNIVVNGKPCEFSGLAVGQSATVTAVDGAAVKIVALTLPCKSRSVYSNKALTAKLLAVDIAAGSATLGISTGEEGQYNRLEVALDPNMVVLVDGSPADREYLKPDQLITAAIVRGLVMKMELATAPKGPPKPSYTNLPAVVKVLDEPNKALAVEVKLTDDAPLTKLAVDVNDKTQVIVKGQPGTLSDLKPGEQVHVTTTHGLLVRIEVPPDKMDPRKPVHTGPGHPQPSPSASAKPSPRDANATASMPGSSPTSDMAPVVTDQNSAAYRLKLANLYRSGGNVEEAIKLYRQILRDFPGTEEATLASEALEVIKLNL